MPAVLRRISIPSMPLWIRRRIGFSFMVLIAAILLNFFIPRLMPGDITDYYLSIDDPPEMREYVLAELGLDGSLWSQFWTYIGNILTFDFGLSLADRSKTVLQMIADALPRTLLLLIPAQIISIGIGYFLGVIAGWKAGSKTDSAITGTSLVIWAMPMFWTAMIFLYVFGFLLDWFPIRGYYSYRVWDSLNFFEQVWDRIYYVILPTLALATKFGVYQLVMRNTMTITLKQNYITTARAKGLSERRVKHRHAARNALMPTVAAAGMRFATLIAGIIFIERVFTYPGMGLMIFEAVNRNDYPVLQASFLVFAIVVIVAIFMLDMIYARLDPRVRYD